MVNEYVWTQKHSVTDLKVGKALSKGGSKWESLGNLRFAQGNHSIRSWFTSRSGHQGAWRVSTVHCLLKGFHDHQLYQREVCISTRFNSLHYGEVSERLNLCLLFLVQMGRTPRVERCLLASDPAVDRNLLHPWAKQQKSLRSWPWKIKVGCSKHRTLGHAN